MILAPLNFLEITMGLRVDTSALLEYVRRR